MIVLSYIKEQAAKSLQDLSTQPTSTTESETSTTESETSTTESETSTTESETSGTDASNKSGEITQDALLEVCDDILKNSKLTLDELREKIKMRPGFEDETKWVTKIYELIRRSKIFLTRENENAD